MSALLIPSFYFVIPPPPPPHSFGRWLRKLQGSLSTQSPPRLLVPLLIFYINKSMSPPLDYSFLLTLIRYTHIRPHQRIFSTRRRLILFLHSRHSFSETSHSFLVHCLPSCLIIHSFLYYPIKLKYIPGIYSLLTSWVCMCPFNQSLLCFSTLLKRQAANNDSVLH